MGFMCSTTVTSVGIELARYVNDYKTYISSNPQRKPEIISNRYVAEKELNLSPQALFVHSRA